MQTFLNQSMIRNLPLCFPGVAIIIISNIQTTESVSCPPNNGIYDGVKYTGSESYSEIRNIGPIRCFHECSLFTGCTFVNYDKMQFICYLFNTELNETSVKPDVGFAIMHNISQDKVCTSFPDLGYKCRLHSILFFLKYSNIVVNKMDYQKFHFYLFLRQKLIALFMEIYLQKYCFPIFIFTSDRQIEFKQRFYFSSTYHA